MPPRPEVSCVLPVLDEDACLEEVVRELIGALAMHTGAFELIAIDDGSTDRSGAILDAIAVQEPRVRVVHFAENRGYGAALREGFAASTLPLVFFMDSDGQFDPRDLGALLARAGEGDLVVGYRVSRRDSPLRSALSRGYNAAVRALLPIGVRDVNCAFKLIHRRVLHAIRLESPGYAINAELLALGGARGFSVVEVGVQHRERRAGASKIAARDVPRSLAALLALRRRLTRPSLRSKR